MDPGARLVVAVWLAVAGAGAAVDKKYNITVGYLPSLTGDMHHHRQGLTISGALTFALEEINNSIDILPDVKILLEWHDTKSDSARATQLVTNMSNSGVVAFFGPEGHCHNEAIVAQRRNLPMMSYNCLDHQMSSLSNFVRLEPSGIQAVKSVISLLRYYRWKKFSILYEEPWSTVALMLEDHAEKNNMTINHRQAVIDSFNCCREKLTCCDPNWYENMIQVTKNRTRIYVFLGTKAELVDMMDAMESLQLFTKGENMVIFVDMMTYMPEQALSYLMSVGSRLSTDFYGTPVCPNTPEFKKRAQSLLVVVKSELTSKYQNFADKVREYNEAAPFNFPEGTFSTVFSIKKHVSINAAYLYDSMKIYSAALDDLIQEDTQKEQLSYSKLMRIVKNGSRIVERIIRNSPYQSVTGSSIRLDERAESQGDFLMLAFKPTAPNDVIKCSHSMIPVGHFVQSASDYPMYMLNPRLPIDWPGYVKPEDEPFNSAVQFQVLSTKVMLTAIFVTFVWNWKYC